MKRIVKSPVKSGTVPAEKIKEAVRHTKGNGEEMTKVKIEATYDGPLNDDVDKKIDELLSSIGAVWYAQGTDRDGVRDIAYDLDINGGSDGM